MTRVLFWIGLIVLVVFAIRSKLRAAARESAHENRPRSSTRAPAEIESEPMARCEFCGVHFPASEAVRAEGRDYCSPAHARHIAP